jgi:hypothetical protein
MNAEFNEVQRPGMSWNTSFSVDVQVQTTSVNVSVFALVLENVRVKRPAFKKLKTSIEICRDKAIKR